MIRLASADGRSEGAFDITGGVGDASWQRVAVPEDGEEPVPDSSPSAEPAAIFGSGSIAFSRAGDLFVAEPDGSEPQRLAERDPGNSIPLFQFAFSPDQRRLAYATYGDGRGGRLVIADADGRILGSLDDPAWLEFSWAPDGQRLAVYLASTGEFVIVGLDGQRLGTLSLPDGFQLRPIDMSIVAAIPWSPDGRWIAAPGCVLDRGPCGKTSHRYLLVATDGSGSRWLTSDASFEQNDTYLAWAPDGRVAVPMPAAVAIGSVDGEWHAVPVPIEPEWLAWSPDGSRLAVSGFGSGAGAVIVGPDGASIVGGTGDEDGCPSLGGPIGWSTDGSQLLFSTAPLSDAPAASLWAMDADGTQCQLLVDGIDGYAFDVN
jgi:Tol biopolymer transport system component